MVEYGPTPAIRPEPTLGARVDGLARACVPVALTLVLLLLTGVPFGLPGQPALRPALALICVFHYSLTRPATMPAIAVFAIGLLCDLLGWLPIGIGAITLLAARAVALRLRARLLGRGLVLIWLAFLGVAAWVAAITWALASLLSLRALPVGPVFLVALFAAALHPSLALLFGFGRPGLQTGQA